MGFKLTNEEGYSLSIAVWLGDDDYDHSPVPGLYISATGLLKPIRMIVLDQRARAAMALSGVDEVIDISRYVPSRLGTAVHSAIENTWLKVARAQSSPKGVIKNIMTIGHNKAMVALGYPEKIIKRIRVNPSSKEVVADPNMIAVYMEQRAYKKLLGYTVGGMFDFVGDGTLEDFKSMGVYGYMQGNKDEGYMLQGSIYRWLNPDIIKADHMLIQQIFTDWSKLDAMIKGKRGYPKQRILSKRIELMSVKETDNWIKRKLSQVIKLKDVPEADLPRCEKEDLWQSDTQYKYYKNPEAKRATKVFTNFPDAKTHRDAKGEGVIKEFPGVVRRCGYCSAFDLCTQKDEYIEAGILKLP